MPEKEKGGSRTGILLVLFFVVMSYLALSPFSRFIVFIPRSVFKYIRVIDYVLGAGIVLFFFSKYSVLSFRKIYAAIRESRLAKGFLLLLFILFLASVSSYLLTRKTSLLWAILTTIIAGLLLSFFVSSYIRYLNFSLKSPEEKLKQEFEVRRKRNYILFSSFVSLLFAVPAVIFLLNYSIAKIFIIFSSLSWVVFVIGVINYVRYVTLKRTAS
jgi:hypothetical protein